MRLGIYTRVSTLIGQSPEMQLAELREYASRRGWEIFDEYVDSGISGSKELRPKLNHLMSDVHPRRFDVVLCWKVDRFGRSLKHLVNALADLDSYGVAFVSLRALWQRASVRPLDVRRLPCLVVEGVAGELLFRP